MADPKTIVTTAKAGRRVVGWRLQQRDRDTLLARFPPRYQRTVADHVTLAANVASATPLPEAVAAEVVGHADDQQGVEALAVRIDGSTERPDGSVYHLTWSLGPGRHAKESNDVLKNQGWLPVAEPIAIGLVPALLR